MTLQTTTHDLAAALDAIGFIGQIIVEPRNQRFSFDQGVRNLFSKLDSRLSGDTPLAELDRRIDAQDLGVIHAVLEKPFDESRRLILEYAVTDDAGHRRIIQSHCKAMQLDHAGRVSRLLGVLIDVTPLRPERQPQFACSRPDMKDHAAAVVDDLVFRSYGEVAEPDRTCRDRPTLPKGELLTMQDVAERLQLPSRTLRFFEDRGLVSPTHDGDDRLFTPEQLGRLTFSARMRRIGFTIAEIRSMLEDNKDQAHPRIDPKRAQAQRRVLEEQIEALKEAARLLDHETGDRPHG